MVWLHRSRDALVRRMKKIDIAQGKKLRGDQNDVDGGDKKLYEII